MADAAAEAAGTAVDEVADAESEQRARSEGASTSGTADTALEYSDAVLQQRTYFVPTMVCLSLSGRCRHTKEDVATVTLLPFTNYVISKHPCIARTSRVKLSARAFMT